MRADFEFVQVADVIDGQVAHVRRLLGEVVEGASVAAANISRELVDLGPTVWVEEMLGEGVDDDLVHGLLRVLGRRLENYVEVLGQSDGELVRIRGGHRDITIPTPTAAVAGVETVPDRSF
ncbi:MAG: hypothetical protein ACXV8G_04945 [Acidimicrobiales bacterium]